MIVMRYEVEDDIMDEISKYPKTVIMPFTKSKLEFGVLDSIQNYKSVYVDNSG